MKKTFICFALLFTIAFCGNAKPISGDDALKAAVHFWNANHPATVKPVSNGDLVPVAFDSPALPMLHLFRHLNNKGFVIVSADDRVRPVLAYSFDNPLADENINDELAYWLQGINDQIALAAKLDLASNAKAVAEWNTLLNGSKSEDPGDITSSEFMLTTKWNQSTPFNQYCPYDSLHHERTVVGCVATAMAQIMKYWNYPSCGEGSRSYVPQSWHSSYNFGTLSADFEHTTYLWQFMPDILDFVSLSHERDAVATLSYHCGVAVEMMYGSSSGAYSSCGPWATACATNAFWEHFKYDTSLFFASRDQYSDSAWCALIDVELAAHRPIYYDGSDSTGGHAFVLDGTDHQSRYHFNWGWGGYGDGFYTIDNLAPGSGGAGGNATYTFNNGQGAIFGIKPRGIEYFDTVDYYDTTCSINQYVDFHEYHLRAVEMDTLLRHLDTIFNYHLRLTDTKRIALNSNGAGQDPQIKQFCPATGYTFPECPFYKDSSIFIGWCRSKTGDDTIYQPGEHVNLRTNRTYFALWLDTTSTADTTGNLGINSLDDAGMKLWPNPTTGEFHISLPDGTESLFVTDVLGRVVFRNSRPNAMGRTAKISLESLPKGIYTVQVKTAERIYKQRIIKR